MLRWLASQLPKADRRRQYRVREKTPMPPGLAYRKGGTSKLAARFFFLQEGARGLAVVTPSRWTPSLMLQMFISCIYVLRKDVEKIAAPSFSGSFSGLSRPLPVRYVSIVFLLLCDSCASCVYSVFVAICFLCFRCSLCFCRYMIPVRYVFIVFCRYMIPVCYVSSVVAVI